VDTLLRFYDYPGPASSFSALLVDTRPQLLIYSVAWQSRVRSAYPVNNVVPAF